MNIVFDKCDVFVNNTGVLAESVSINSNNSLTSVYGIGRAGANITHAGPVAHSISMNYLVQVDNEPNFLIASGLKNLIDDSSYKPITLEVCGVTGFGFLQSYSLSVRPNDLARAHVNYVSYVPLSGSPSEQGYSGNYGGYNNFAHGWSTFISDGNGYMQSPVYDLSYAFNAEWAPIYTLIRDDATEVKYISSREQVSMSRRDYTQVQLSGQKGEDLFNNGSVEFLTLGVVCSGSDYEQGVNPTGIYTKLNVNLSGFKVTETETSVGVDDVLRNDVTLIKYY